VKSFILPVIAVLAWLGGGAIPAEAAIETVKHMEALAVYPAEIRGATAEVLLHPDLLLKLAQLREESKAQFNKLMANYPKKNQEMVWKILHYRKLWRDLEANAGSPATTQDLLKSYPKDIQKMVPDLIKEQPDIIAKVSALEKQTYQSFYRLISTADPKTQAVFKTVGKHSEIFSILSEALGITASTKEVSPELKQKAKDLSLQLVAMNVNNAETSSKAKISGSNDNAASTLKSAEATFNRDADLQMDEDPFPKGANVAEATYTQYPFYNSYTGRFYYPYWYGFPFWW